MRNRGERSDCMQAINLGVSLAIQAWDWSVGVGKAGKAKTETV